MKNMKVSMKLTTGFLIMIILAAIVGAVGLYGLSSMSDEAEHMYSGMAVPLSSLADAIEYNQRIRVQLRNLIIETGHAAELDAIEADMEDHFKNFEDSANAYLPSLATEDARNLFTEVMAQFNDVLKPGLAELITFARDGMDQESLQEEMSHLTDAVNTIGANLDELMTLRLGVMSDANNITTDMFNTLFIVIIAAICVAIAAALFLAFYISGLISKPLAPLCGFMQQASTSGNINLRPEDVRVIENFGRRKDEIGRTIAATSDFVKRVNEVSSALGTIAEGDLTAEIAPLSDQDVLGNSLQKMTQNLNSMFGEINTASSQVSTGSHQVADGAQALAAGSTEQAASVQQLSSSIAEVAERTKDNSIKAEQAAKLAFSIKSSAEKGSGQMADMIKSVEDINEASQSISKVIKTIDDIAFQTNILALNAAVEAARAGQHGKGFAVVAEEVRNLSAKSAQAAKDTEALIADSMQKAEHGVKVAGETSTSLSEIVSGINESSALITEIAQASEEQSMSISQINTGIDQVAKVVQQNSATAEESAAASEEMSSQSAMLRELISQFQLKDNSTQRRIAGQQGEAKQISAPAKEFEYSGDNRSFGKY